MILRRLAYGFSSLALSLSSLFVLASPVAHAANVAWDGEGADNNFSTAANWAGDVLPIAGDIIVFDQASVSDGELLTNDLMSLAVAGITFTGTGTDRYAIAGNDLTVGGNIYFDGKANISLNIILSADITIHGSSGQFGDPVATTPNTIDLGGHVLTNQNEYLSIFSVIQGAGNLVTTATSSTELLKANTFTGQVTVNGGVKIYEGSGFGNASNTVTVTGIDDASVGFCGLDGAIVSNNFVLNAERVYGILSSTGGCGMGAALTESDPNANVTLSGNITLQKNTKVASAGVMTVTGPLAGNFTIGIIDGQLGSLVVNSSNNTSLTPNGNVQSNTQTVEATDKQPLKYESVQANQVFIVKETGERGAIDVTGGTLKGTGTVGAVTMASGKVAPGLSPGILNTGNLAFTGGTLEIEIGGATAGNGDGFYDQTNVTGTVSLGTDVTTLNTILWNNYAPSVGQSYTIINNDSNDAVTGTFNGMADDSSFTQNGVTYTINYNGGDGNDVVLTVTAVPATATAPNTGFEQLKNNPLLTLVMTLVAVAGISFAALKQFADKK